MDLVFSICVVCLNVTFVTISLYWLLQKLLKSSCEVKGLPGPGKYAPQEPYSFLYLNPSPYNSFETHIPMHPMLGYLPPHHSQEYRSLPISATPPRYRALFLPPIHDPTTDMLDLHDVIARVYTPLPDQDVYVYHGVPTAGIYSPHISVANNECYETSFRGPVPPLRGVSAGMGGPVPPGPVAGMGGWSGYPYSGIGLTHSMRPTFAQPADNDVDANEKPYGTGIKESGCGVNGVGNYAPVGGLLAPEQNGQESIPEHVSGEFMRMPRGSGPPEKSIGRKACGCECSAHTLGKDAPGDSLLGGV